MSSAVEQQRFACPSCRAVFRTGFARCPIDGSRLQRVVDDPLAGSMFADRYVIEECIGEGGMGRVYRARHQKISRKFAVKVLFGDHATDPTMRERFGREAESASRLDHPNVVSVIDYGETDEGLLYLVMDFVQGRELAAAVDEGPMPAERTRTILGELCRGLDHAHGHGLVHRDFKTENVLLADKGVTETARIVDFGIAVMMEGSSERLTTDGIVVGTPAYMSPEQAIGDGLDHRTDLFSLGVILYEMLAGVLPFEGSPLAIARQNLAADPPPISDRVPGLEVDAGLEATAMKLMQKRREDRYQSAAEILEALESPGEPERTAPAAPTPVAAEPAQPAPVAITVSDDDSIEMPAVSRTRLWPAIVALLALAGAVALLLSWNRGGDSSVTTAAVIDAGAAPAPPPDAAQPAPAAIDAAVAQTEVADAAAVAAPAPRPDAKPAAKPDPKKNKNSKDPAPKPPEVTPESFRALYKAVGRKLDALSGTNPGAAGKLAKRYLAIPYADAERNPALREESYRKLRRLHREIAQATKQ